MVLEIPEQTQDLGFVIDGLGAHSGRTIMLKDLKLLFSSCSANSQLDDYKYAIINDNILLKKSGSSRKEAFIRLKRLYGLETNLLLFRVFRHLWDKDTSSQPLLTILYAITRDPILRSSVEIILNSNISQVLFAKDFEAVVDNRFPNQFTKISLSSIGRNISSSWSQSGHLKGRSIKTRVQVTSRSIPVMYALFLGYLCGLRGENLFNTDWVKLLDTPRYELFLKAQTASQQGWLEFRQSGSITDISFNYFLKGVKYE